MVVVVVVEEPAMPQRWQEASEPARAARLLRGGHWCGRWRRSELRRLSVRRRPEVLDSFPTKASSLVPFDNDVHEHDRHSDKRQASQY